MFHVRGVTFLMRQHLQIDPIPKKHLLIDLDYQI